MLDSNHLLINTPFMSLTVPDIKSLNNVGIALHSQGFYEEALKKLVAALELEPHNPVVCNNLAVCYFSLDQFESSVQSYEKAISLDPRYVEAHNNRGNALVKLFKYEEALKSYDQALFLDPTYVEAYWNKALALLQIGRFSEGWVLHESRWAKPSFQPIVRHFPQPIWDGSFSIAGKTLLLHAEQGLGDTLQFIRYVAQVQTLGARLVLEVQDPLVPLLDGQLGVDALVKQGDPLPPFDCHCPLMSLPLAFQTTLSSIPIAIAYIKSSPEKEHVWAEKLGSTSGLRVGLVWSGDHRHQNDKHRSIPLAEMMAFLPLGLEYVSLQSEIRDSDRQALDDCDRLVHFGPELKDFSDTAALCAQMDLVVCVDTSVAHLSGALGKPTFLLLPYNPDWRWLLERTDSPWYPTMQLYRQAHLGSWQSALENVSADLFGLEKRRFTN
jgi:tetratricopeptide (TPR) repeat protein